MMNNLTVVLGEDDDGPAMLLRKALRRSGLTRLQVRLHSGRTASLPLGQFLPVVQSPEDGRRG